MPTSSHAVKPTSRSQPGAANTPLSCEASISTYVSSGGEQASRAPRRNRQRITLRSGMAQSSSIPRITSARNRFGSQMAVAQAQYTDKTDEQKAITDMVRQFVDEQVIPIAEKHDHEDSFPDAVVEQMKELGLFGVTIPEEHGGMGLDLTTYAMIVEELSRGWISVSGIVNTHFIGSYLLMKFGTDEQKQEFLPRMATGEIRAAFSLSEPEVGSDVQGIKGSAKQVDGGLGAQRPEDVGHQRPALRPGLRADEDRPAGRPALQGHDLLHHREGARRRRELR